MLNRLPIYTLPVLVIILLGTGCSMLPESDSSLSQQGAIPPDQPMILVEMQSPEKGGSTKRIPLASAPTLQAAVEQSRAASKFRRFHIAISRLPQHQGGEPQKLVSKYNHIEKRVPFEYDYQLQAGDRVVIVEDDTSTFDDVFGGMLSPFRMMSGQGQKGTSPF